MARPSAFDAGFDPSEFGWRRFAELCVIPGTHPLYDDGDIREAINKRTIRDAWAGKLCHPRFASFNSDGLRSLTSLPWYYYSNAARYKFERISGTEVRRTNYLTDPETIDIISNTPNPDGESMDVQAHVQHLTQSPRHAVFGTAGNEVWFDLQRPSWEALDTIWDEIETNSSFREVDYQSYPTTLLELRKYLWISCDDFDDATAELLISSTEGDERLYGVPGWRDLRWVNVADVLDKAKPIDIRSNGKHLRNVIVQGP